MAVNIPVVIDIDKAFDEAAKRVDTAFKPLKNAIENSTAGLRLKIGEEYDYNIQQRVSKYKELDKLIKDVVRNNQTGSVRMAHSVQEWSTALEYAKTQLNDLSQLKSMGQPVNPNLIQSYREAIQILTAAIDQRQHESAIVEEIARKEIGVVRAIEKGNYALIQSAKTVSELSDKISSLKGKLDNLNPRSKEWRATAKEIAKATAKLEDFEAKKNKALNKPGSVNRLSAELSALEQKWAALSKTAKFDKNGNLKKGAQKLIDQYRKLTEEADKYGRSLAQMASKGVPAINATTSALSAQKNVFSGLASYASMYLSLFGFIRFAKQIRDVTGELEYQRVALGHLIQDEQYGAQLFERIKQAAIESPFRITQLVTYTKQLAAYRVEQESLFDTTKRLADVSAGLGVDMNRLILAYGQVRAASVLRGQELRQFTEAGIPLVDLLVEKMGELNDKTYKTADIFKLISERAVPFSAISEIFEELTDKGGMFYQMQAKQAETLKGRWEKLKDAFDIGLQSIGESEGLVNFNMFMNAILKTLTLLAKNLRLIPKILEGGTLAWAAYNAAMLLSGKRTKKVAQANIDLVATEIALEANAPKVTKAHIRMAKARIAEQQATNKLTKALARLRIAALNNPWIVAGAALLGIISTFFTFKKKADDATDSVNDFNKAIEEMAEANKAYRKMDSMIKRYDTLSKKTERTADQNVRLTQTMARLKEEFPEVSAQIRAENLELSDQVELLKKANEERLEEQRQKKIKTLELGESEAERLKDKYDKAADAYEKATIRFNRVKEMENAPADVLINEFNESGVLLAATDYEKQRKKWGKEAREAQETMEKAEEAYLKQVKENERLRKQIYPELADADLTTWQKTIDEMRKFSVETENFELVSRTDVEGYHTLFGALKQIDKIYKDATESAKEMREAMKGISPEAKEAAENELAVEEARRDTAKAILDRFGYNTTREKKANKTELALLKEELKNVQDIYKKYQEYSKMMTREAASSKIKKIYSGVTNIDFLSPETYKKRLADIMAELRKLQGRVREGAKSLTADMADDLKAAIRKNEGFRSKAYKLKGEDYYTIGYGFYKQLSDGRKVVEGMTMTMDEAEAELDAQVQKVANTTKDLITRYGKGIQLTERQFNVLADLAYQGPSALKKALIEANGDAEQLAKALEHAAWPLVAKSQQAAVARRDMRRARLFRLAGADSEEEAKELMDTMSEIEKIVQDVDWDEIEKAFKDRLQRLSDNIKKSEEAKKFFENIFELTGDKTLATTMSINIYGDVGQQLERQLQEQLSNTFVLDEEKLKAAGISITQAEADVAQAIMDGNYSMLDAYYDYVVDNNKQNARQLISDRRKTDAELAKDFSGLIAKYGETAQKISTIRAKTEREISRVTKATALALKDEALTPEQRKAIEERRDAVIRAIKAQEELDIFLQSDDYVKFFSEINVMSAETAGIIRDNIRGAYFKAFQEGAINADQLKRNLRAVDEQYKKLNESVGLFNAYIKGGLEGANRLLQDYADTVQAIASKISAGKKIDSGEEEFLTRMMKHYGTDEMKGYETATEFLGSFSNNAEGMAAAGKAFQAMGKGMSSMAANGPGALAIVDAIFQAVNSTINAIQQTIDELNRLRSEDQQLAESFRYIADFNKYTYSGWEKFKSGDFIGATADAISSWISIFNNAQQDKVNRLNKKIQNQQHLIDELSYSYDRLRSAEESALGPDYVSNYNARLKALLAEQTAYEKQTQLERAKGKSRDKEKIRDYQNSAREVADQIAEMQREIAEKMMGTDVASAARDFASSWIDAYKEFSSTTDAIKEKFNSMIQNMIVESLAAKVVEQQLTPIFDMINRLATDDNQLSIVDAAIIAEQARAAVDNINLGMTNLMNALSGAGLNIRTMGTGLSGIAKDIQGASEESILGLAAGVNTQNFYLQQINSNVLTILQSMSHGEATPSNPAVEIPYVEGPEFMGRMESIDRNIATILQRLDSVITPKNTNSNTHCIGIK